MYNKINCNKLSNWYNFASYCGYNYATQLSIFLHTHVAPNAKLSYFRICHLLFSISRQNFKISNPLIPIRKQ